MGSNPHRWEPLVWSNGTSSTLPEVVKNGCEETRVTPSVDPVRDHEPKAIAIQLPGSW